MSERDDLTALIADTIKDYRAGKPFAPTPDHVDRWVCQFDEIVQVPLLREMDFVLKRTYFSSERVTDFLKTAITTKKWAGDNPCEFWKRANFLNIQLGGNSQREMLTLFDKLLIEQCGYSNESCGGGDNFIYLDDAVFTGNRVLKDLKNWIKGDAPSKATVHIVSIVLHKGADYYVSREIHTIADGVGKTIHDKWSPFLKLETRKAYSDRADVLRPTVIPDDPDVREYVAGMRHKPTMRSPGNIGGNKLFSSDEGKALLEQEFLKAGAKIRKTCPNLGEYMRPLGNMLLEELGFGSLFVTYRNCPNTAPLALWVADPWYPLFPRTTNRQTEDIRSISTLIPFEGSE
ncbi:MAG: hypothetical protein OXU61_10880 [Gammaproteobacteria bacterium]|nr:hypothetical protein [Gammaproteobacteria bacterium]MDD9863686.1 hypothetical protein [Gammaproteobacteria bacterium]